MRQHQPVTTQTPAEPEVPDEPAPPVEEPPAQAPAAPPAVPPAAPRPSPHHLAELSGTFAMTAAVHDPEPVEAPPAAAAPEDDHPLHHHHHQHHDEVVSERGLRGLVGGGASQVSVSAALRARDAARPTDADLAAAERDLQIIRRGWVPREELTRPGRRSPTS